MKPDTTIQKLKSQGNSVHKTSGSKLMKCSEANVKAYPWQKFSKKKVWIKARHYSKEMTHIKRIPRVTNTKWLIILWVPKSEIVFTNMLIGNAYVLMSG